MGCHGDHCQSAAQVPRFPGLSPFPGFDQSPSNSDWRALPLGAEWLSLSGASLFWQCMILRRWSSCRGEHQPCCYLEARPAGRGAPIREHSRLPVGTRVGPTGSVPFSIHMRMRVGGSSQGSRRGTTSPPIGVTSRGRLGGLGLPYPSCRSRDDLGQPPPSPSGSPSLGWAWPTCGKTKLNSKFLLPQDGGHLASDERHCLLVGSP